MLDREGLFFLILESEILQAGQMKFTVLNDTLADLYAGKNVLDYDEELFEDILQRDDPEITPAHFVRYVDIEQMRDVLMSDSHSEILGAPIGGRDALAFLREEMLRHEADHSRSVAAIDRLTEANGASTTLDSIGEGFLGVYSKKPIKIPEPLSLGDPEACAKALEDFDMREYEARLVKFLARFQVKWPMPAIEVEPLPPEEEMMPDVRL